MLSNVQNVELNEVLPVIDGEQIHPLRVSFDEGYFFLRLYHIFSTYESQMQVYDQLFLTLHKVGDINGEDTKSINTKLSQFSDPTVFTYTTISNNDSTTTIDNLDLTRHLPQLTVSYDNIHNRLNDNLGRLGLAGDDAVKPERVTTGENFRALQPTAAFQQSVLNRLANLTERITTHFNQQVTFTASLQSNPQGIPEMGYTQENQYQSVKPAKGDDKG